jgi:hypothetical protein
VLGRPADTQYVCHWACETAGATAALAKLADATSAMMLVRILVELSFAVASYGRFGFCDHPPLGNRPRTATSGVELPHPGGPPSEDPQLGLSAHTSPLTGGARAVAGRQKARSTGAASPQSAR